MAETPEPEPIFGVEDALKWLGVVPDRLTTRQAEIDKLEGFGCFVPVPWHTIPDGVRLFEYLWVETPGKSRLTMQDRRTFGEPDELVHCPTPSMQTNNLMEYISIHFGLPMWVWDVVSAFPHSPDNIDNIYMRPPREWRYSGQERMVWWMRTSLYGRRSAGANFRDHLEDIALATPQMHIVRGSAEPCAFRDTSESASLRMTHHIDDGRIVASMEHGKHMIMHLATYFLLKVSDPITTGKAMRHLGRTKIRLERGWATIPDAKRVQNVFSRVGYGEDRAPGKSVSTPGLKRTGNEIHNQQDPDETSYRPAVGSLIYYSLDIELLAYTVKELARGLQKPTPEDWADLKRCARWLWDHQDMAVISEVDEFPPDFNPFDEIECVVEQDSDWAGSRDDRRSTSGYRSSIRNFRIGHASQTQPGLPALSSGEAELRSLNRAATEGLYLKQIASELGLSVKITVKGDASAAYKSAERLGPGKIKHLEVGAYFVKEAVRKKYLHVVKIPRAVNRADALTHFLSPADFKKRYEEQQCVKVSGLPSFEIMPVVKINSFEQLTPWTSTARELTLPDLRPADAISFELTQGL